MNERSRTLARLKRNCGGDPRRARRRPLTPQERAADDLVVGDARWPMVGAVIAAMLLTLLLPDEVRQAPRG
jgi:hypothetical protein